MDKEKSVNEILEMILPTHFVNGINEGYKTCNCEGCKYVREQFPKAKSALLSLLLEKLPKEKNYPDYGGQAYNQCLVDCQEAIRRVLE